MRSTIRSLNASGSDNSGIFHQPAMIAEVIERLLTNRDGCYVDATLGGGGHAEAILANLSGRGKLIGIDKDLEAIAAVRTKFSQFEGQFLVFQADFRKIDQLLDDIGCRVVDGILFDLGVSSHQINKPERGFSYRMNGPLDMRMDQANGITAADIVNRRSAEELSHLFCQYGEERFAQRVARAIVARRQVQPITTTGDLSAIVARVVPGRWPQKTAARIFQAIRIATNNEIDSLRDALRQAVYRLSPDGRIVIISYHSLEDRVVKEMFRSFAAENVLEILNKKPVMPSHGEVERNPRARSAKLRAATRK